MAIWDDVPTERDKQVFAKAGYGRRQRLGRRPALLIIDMNSLLSKFRAPDMGVGIYATSGASYTSVRFVPGQWSSRALSVSHSFARASLLRGLARECRRTRKRWSSG